ncbi:MAG: phage portal protein [Clostridia bacterium]
MGVTIGNRIKKAWNVFIGKTPYLYSSELGSSYGHRPDRVRFTKGNKQTIVASIYNRIGIDSACISIRHVKLDDNNRFLYTIDSGIDNCLTLEANIDQTGRSFLQDVVMSILDEGCVAIIPVDTVTTESNIDILTMRTGKILDWYPEHIRVRVYNEKTGRKEEIVLPKKSVAIIENPLFAVINEPNSTMQRLIRKLSLLDAVDEQSSSGKLDLIIQLPYVIKSDARKQQAEQRRLDIEQQLSSTKYGIAYTDGTEKITQLNRSVENNLMTQIEFLTSMLYSQLGITQSILDGTADEQTMLNYYNRTIEPILSAIVDEMKRKFLSETDRKESTSIVFFRDPFKLVPVNNISEIADKFTRNEIMTSNEIRQIIGMKPSEDPKADELRNKNLSAPSEDVKTEGED